MGWFQTPLTKLGFGKVIKKFKYQLKPLDVKDIDKAIKKRWGYLEGSNVKLTQKVEALEEAFRQRKTLNVSEKLTKEKEAIEKSYYKGGVSMKRLFIYQELMRKRKKRPIIVQSVDYEKNFGEFEDIWVTPSGSTTLVIKDETGKIDPLISGPSFRDIIRNYEGLIHIPNGGSIIINYDKNGDFIPNLFDEEVPDVIIDKQGKINFKPQNTKTFMKHITKLTKQTNEIQNELTAATQAQIEENMDRQLAESRAEIAQEHASNLQGIIKKDREKIPDIIESLHASREEIAQLSLKAKMAEDFNELAEKTVDEVKKKIEKIVPHDMRSNVFNDVINQLDVIRNFSRGIHRDVKGLVEAKPQPLQPTQKKE